MRGLCEGSLWTRRDLVTLLILFDVVEEERFLWTMSSTAASRGANRQSLAEGDSLTVEFR